MGLSCAVGTRLYIPVAGVVIDRTSSVVCASSYSSTASSISASDTPTSCALHDSHTILSGLLYHLMKLRWCLVVGEEIHCFLQGIQVLIHPQQVVVCKIELQLIVPPLVSSADEHSHLH